MNNKKIKRKQMNWEIKSFIRETKIAKGEIRKSKGLCRCRGFEQKVQFQHLYEVANAFLTQGY